MSISFSGLASGLDTSSWIESLTALKRAKVETYQAEKQNLLLSQQTLSSIKNFFNSFRSVIEKVTDTKFGTGKLDVFSQNLAVSSKTNILTAIANNDAQEGTYTINVNNLASNTQAVSNYSHITTQTISQTATLGSTLDSLGVNTGRIGVTVNNIERTIRIGNNETIQSFIEKLNNIGAKASYNESTGSFSMNVGTNDIRDIDNTGIINALHLKGINEGYISNALQTAVVDTIYEQANLETKLSELGIVDGSLYLYKYGKKEIIDIDSIHQTLNDLINSLNSHGINAELSDDGYLSITENSNLYIVCDGTTHFFEVMGYDPRDTNKDIVSTSQTSKPLSYTTTVVEETVANRNYESSAPLGVANSSTQNLAAQRDTKLSDLGVTTGEYCIYNNGVKNMLFISSDDTIGSFINTLKSFGIEAGINTPSDAVGTTLYLRGNGNTYLAKSNGTYSSNVVEKLFGSNDIQQETSFGKSLQSSTTTTTTQNATEDTKINDVIYLGLSLRKTDNVTVKLNDDTFTFGITEDETIGSFLDKIRTLGVEATISDGKILINSGNNNLSYITGMRNGSLYRLGLTKSSDIEGACATESGKQVASTNVVVEERNDSVANYADYNTKLDLLNISSGSLTIYRNGEKATIQVDSNQTFGDLRSKIAAKFSDVDLKFENGYLTISSNNNNAEILVGTTTDTSNFAAITGMHSENKKSISSRTLYCVNNDSKVTNSGLFARGTVSEGDFKVGNATITINKDTTINDIISQINYNDNSNATAYWDSIEGKFVIKAKTTGSSMINIEAGSSNFTDIMGFTFKEGGKSKMNMNSQQLGQNARFTINRTNFTSNSNTITSDISRIAGVTINLKDITTDEPVTVTVEKDKETAANAVSDIVDAYNELIDNIDKEVSRTGNLSGESTLRLIRNQIRSLMTGSIANTGSFRNLASVGISLSAATSGNIRTDNINTLKFDKDKFTNAFGSDLSSLKSLLVGTDEKQGILTQVENVLEQALGGVTGYFASAEKSYTNKISKLDDKISKTNKAADRYKARLEAKFKAMDMIISKVQNQYSSFLGS